MRSFIIALVLSVAAASADTQTSQKRKGGPTGSPPPQVAAPATAANSASSNQVWEKEPEGFVGIKLGEPFAVSPCPLLPRDRYSSVDFLDSNAMKSLEGVCRDTTKSTWGRPYAHVLAHLPEIGILYRVTVYTKDSVVHQITIDWEQLDFDEMLSAFKTRYGSPTSFFSETVKTNAGAEFNAATVVWKGKKLSIRMYERLGRIDESHIVFSENAIAERDAEAQRAKRASESKKF